MTTTTYVLGAGASIHAGYPFVKDMGSVLTQWMKERDGYCLYPFRETVRALQREFGDVSNIETLLENIEKRVKSGLAGYSVFAEVYYPALKQALRDWFGTIHQQDRATAYRMFAEKVIRPGDCIITFNYDVALERELKQANLWTLGRGYGFPVHGFETSSPVTILKLHGSIGWWAPLIGGVTSGEIALGSHGLFGPRPIFSETDLSALGYKNSVDPFFRAPTPAIPSLILPTSQKKFYFDANLGPEWEGFWDLLWEQAKNALGRSDRIVICGYGLFPVDQRGCDLLLSGQISADFEVCCGTDTERIVQQLQLHGRRAHGAPEKLFESWVAAADALQ